MAHSEIWDDSALVDSWNEAVEEYKRYHSIHARGEKIEDILSAFTRKDGVSEVSAIDYSTRQGTTGTLEPSNGMDEEHDDPGMAEAVPRDPAADSQAEDKLSIEDQALRSKPSESRSQGAPPLPLQHLVGSVHDEGLKSLLMSWYYAGYYTGLYEGQHQAR